MDIEEKDFNEIMETMDAENNGRKRYKEIESRLGFGPPSRRNFSQLNSHEEHRIENQEGFAEDSTGIKRSRNDPIYASSLSTLTKRSRINISKGGRIDSASRRDNSSKLSLKQS